MARKNNTQDNAAEIAHFAALEDALKGKIDAAESLTDPAERLLRYKAIREDAMGTYEKNKIAQTKEQSIASTGKNGRLAGGLLGFITGWTTSLTLAASSVVVPLLGAFAAIPLAALFVAAIIVGAKIGKNIGEKRGETKFENHSPEEKYATRMCEMVNEITTALKSLENSFTKKEKLATLPQNEHFKDIMDAFPKIKAAFNEHRKLINKQQALLGQRAPSTTVSAAAPSA